MGMDKRESGARGETLALTYLEKLGYTLICRNAHFGHDEIDLILHDGDTTVFVEVKARSSSKFGMGREAVDVRKQKRMARAAQVYLIKSGEDIPARFDVVEVDLCTGGIVHIPDAFMADA